MKVLRNTKGITLIALVITIIVLLILAGVSISMLTGDNGILTKAATAKEKTSQAEAEELVKLAILASYGQDGKIDYNDLMKNLKDISGIKEVPDSITDSSFPLTVKIKEQDVEITKTGNTLIAEVAEPLTGIIAEIVNAPEDYYGKQVTNYKASESDTNVYRIFYVDTKGEFGDKNTVYLKADYSETTYTLNNYASYDATNTKVRQMNPDWTDARGDLEKDAEGNITWNTNEQAAAYLCSPVFTNAERTVQNSSLPWASYYNAEYANYVIGGPSIEMYVKSYNQAYKDYNAYVLGAEYSATALPGYIYTLNGEQSTLSNDDYWTGGDSLDYKKYNSMYCGKNGNKAGFWWLASPCACNNKSVCGVGGDIANLSFHGYDGSYSLSPLVSLKSDFPIQVAE